MKHHVGFSIASLFVLFACAPTEDAEDSQTEESDLRVNGSTLGSAFAKAGTVYLSARSIASLQARGALHSSLDVIAVRADGILEGGPGDGQVSLKELLQLERPETFTTLFPNEQDALRRFWILMEAAQGNARVTREPPPALTVSLREIGESPGVLAPPSQLDIVSLPNAYQTTARRVQLTYNSDGNAATISEADVRAAKARIATYTLTELNDMDLILGEFRARATSSYGPKLEVSEPVYRVTELGTFGALTFNLQDHRSYSENRALLLDEARTGTMDTDLRAKTGRWLSIESPTPLAKILFIDEKSGQEFLYSPEMTVPAATYTIETWQGNMRVDSTHVRVRTAIEHIDTTTDMKAYLDYPLYAKGVPLLRNIPNAFANNHTSFRAYYTFDTAVTRSGTVDQEAVDMLTTPTSMPVGRYVYRINPDDPADTLTIDVSSSGIVRLGDQYGWIRAALRMQNGVMTFTCAPAERNRVRMVLVPKDLSLKFYIEGGSTLFNGKLDPLRRTG